MPVCPAVYSPVCSSIHPSAYPPVYPPVYLPGHLFTCLSTRPSTRLSTRLSACLPACLPARLPARLPVACCQDLVEMNQSLLRLLGVSHPSLEQVCQLCSSHGLHCKLTGAGGGGCAVTLISPGQSPSPSHRHTLVSSRSCRIP